MSKIQSRTTIDNLHIDAHRRYAKDQNKLDPRFGNVDAVAVSPHAEIAGTSSIYASQLDQLILSYIGTLPWASFQAPHGYLMQTNRFFRSGLFPRTKQTVQEHEEDKQGDQQDGEEKENQEDEHPLLATLQKKYAARSSSQVIPQEERDKSTLTALLQEISQIDALLAQITARKLQYQKG